MRQQQEQGRPYRPGADVFEQHAPGRRPPCADPLPQGVDGEDEDQVYAVDPGKAHHQRSRLRQGQESAHRPGKAVYREACEPHPGKYAVPEEKPDIARIQGCRQRDPRGPGPFPHAVRRAFSRQERQAEADRHTRKHAGDPEPALQPADAHSQQQRRQQGQQEPRADTGGRACQQEQRRRQQEEAQAVKAAAQQHRFTHKAPPSGCAASRCFPAGTAAASVPGSPGCHNRKGSRCPRRSAAASAPERSGNCAAAGS